MHGGGLTHGVSLVPFAYVTLVEKGTSALVPRLLSKNQEEKLGADSTACKRNLYPEVSLVVDVDGERDDEADAINDQQVVDHILSNMVLSINQLLNTLLQVKLWSFLSLLQHVGQKEIRNGIDQLRVIVKLT